VSAEPQEQEQAAPDREDEISSEAHGEGEPSDAVEPSAHEDPPPAEPQDLMALAQEPVQPQGAQPQGAQPEYDFEYETGQGFAPQAAVADGVDPEVWNVLENGIRDIAGEVRNSLDFHRSQDGGGEVSHVLLSGAAEELPGFAESLQLALGVEVRSATVGVVDERVQASVSPHRLAIAAGLAAAETPQ
jgi:Tfp pilus assembly PilM family ATPase